MKWLFTTFIYLRTGIADLTNKLVAKVAAKISFPLGRKFFFTYRGLNTSPRGYHPNRHSTTNRCNNSSSTNDDSLYGNWEVLLLPRIPLAHALLVSSNPRPRARCSLHHQW